MLEYQFNDVARICHEANRALQVVNQESNVSPAWDEAPQWQRDSALEGVRAAFEGATPEQLHESWLKQKTDDGWVYGEVKDENAKTHPCIISYADLPEDQRIKDDLFQAVVGVFK